MGHHDTDTPVAANRSPANRLGLDYRRVPPRRVRGPIIDVHTHVYHTASTPLFFEAARAYGITKIVSMSPVEEVDTLRAAAPCPLEFIAVPRWRKMELSDEFRGQWLRDLGTFREKGARRMKFWMAPPMRARHGLTLNHPFFAPVIDEALALGYEFMVHVGDPSVWFRPGGKYADAAVHGTKAEQYPQLRYLLERVAPRTVIGAHMSGNIEDPQFLQELLDAYPHYYLDCSATKWIVREVARQPEAVRAFMIRNADRILFGSDLVVAENNDFDHYASRYWAHHAMWETNCRGESPIDDPDGETPPQLAGVDLPPEVLSKLYYDNAVRLGHG